MKIKILTVKNVRDIGDANAPHNIDIECSGKYVTFFDEYKDHAKYRILLKEFKRLAKIIEQIEIED